MYAPKAMGRAFSQSQRNIYSSASNINSICALRVFDNGIKLMRRFARWVWQYEGIEFFSNHQYKVFLHIIVRFE